MAVHSLPTPLLRAQESLAPLLDFFVNSPYRTAREDPDACDFAFGNPQEMPLPGFTNALLQWTPPLHKDWFAYKDNEPTGQNAVAESLKQRLGTAFEPEDIALTNGAFAGLLVVCKAITEPGDEVIFNMPGWFFYESIIGQTGGVPVCVRTRPDSFDLDLDAIEAAITPRTRAVIVNSPNNPSGRIYTPQTLQRLSEIMTTASARYGRTIYLISDEAYSQIVFPAAHFASPTTYYPNSFLVYTFGKVLLTPGQRIGYIALPPTMADRETMREALFVTQTTMGWAFPNAVLQYALPQLTGLSIDLAALRARIDRMGAALTEMGYEVMMPEGTFYMNFVAPGDDDTAFSNLLMEEGVFCLPGRVMQMAGYIRLSMTANDDMVERSLPRFRRAIARAQTS